MREGAGNRPENERGGSSPAPASPADRERVLLLECRLEQLRSSLDEARAEADRARGRLAEAAAREADHARRYSLVHQELAETRAELAALHERLGRSEALRAELEGHLFEAGAHGDAAELVRMRREVIAQRERSVNAERTLARVRSRMNELLLSRETLLTRIAEWQRLVRREDPDAIDLAEFISELRRDILHLEQRNAAGERQEAVLRERLLRAGMDPDGPLSGDPEPVRDDEAAAEASVPRPREATAERKEGDDEADLATLLNGAHMRTERARHPTPSDASQGRPARERRSLPEGALAPPEPRKARQAGSHEEPVGAVDPAPEGGPEAEAVPPGEPGATEEPASHGEPGPKAEHAAEVGRAGNVELPTDAAAGSAAESDDPIVPAAGEGDDPTVEMPAAEREDPIVPAAAEAPIVPAATEADDPVVETPAAMTLSPTSEDGPGLGAEAEPSRRAELPEVAADAHPPDLAGESSEGAGAAEPQQASAAAEVPKETSEPEPPEVAAESEPDHRDAAPERQPDDLAARDPVTRAAAYERLTRLHADDPSGLANRLRPGLADPDPRVRRRAVLAAATSRRLALRPLLDSLRGDPDRQVRRVVREVLRRAPPEEGSERDGTMDDSAKDPVPIPTRAVKQAVP